MRKITLRLCAIIIAMSIVAMLLVGLTACGGGNPKGTNASPASPGNGKPEDIDVSSGKTVITLATFSHYCEDGLEDIVARFNNSSDEYYVQVLDYSKYNSGNDPSAGNMRLKTEIMSGNMPDILDMSTLWYSQFAKMGFLEDLYPYVDADPDYSRSDFWESALRSAEIDGGLYHVFSTFYISSIVGHPAVLGAESGWNMEEFRAVIDAHPEADLPLGVMLDKMGFLLTTIGFDTDSYIDWDARTVKFDTPDFIELLEFANTFPDELTLADYINEDTSADRLVPEGRQIMEYSFISHIFAIQHYGSLFGGEIVIKGFPTERKIGHALQIEFSYAMTTGSENKEGAWQFLRMFLDAEYQIDKGDIPSIEGVFDAQIDRRLSGITPMEGFITIEDVEKEKEVILEGADQLRKVIETASGSVEWIGDRDLRNIVTDTASDYFRGDMTAQEAASVIQNRASILMSERN